MTLPSGEIIKVFPSRLDTVYEPDLDGTVYRFRLRWMKRLNLWNLDISTSGGTPLIFGIKLIPFMPLLTPHRASVSSLPQGILSVLPADGSFDTSKEPPTLANLGVDWVLQYSPRVLVDAWVEAARVLQAEEVSIQKVTP